MVRFFKGVSITDHFLCWVQGFAGLLDSLISICSLGFLCSGFELRFCAWRTLRVTGHLKEVFNKPS